MDAPVPPIVPTQPSPAGPSGEATPAAGPSAKALGKRPTYYFEPRNESDDPDEPDFVVPTKHSKRIVTVKSSSNSSSSKTLSEEDKILRGILLLIGSQARAYKVKIDTISNYIKVLEKFKPKEDNKKLLLSKYISILYRFKSILDKVVVFFKNLVDRSETRDIPLSPDELRNMVDRSMRSKIRSIRDIPLLPDEFLEVFTLFEALYTEYFNLQQSTPIESLNIVYPPGGDMTNNRLTEQTLNPILATIIMTIKEIEKQLKENGGGKLIKEDILEKGVRIANRLNLMLPENNYEKEDEQPGSSSQHAAAAAAAASSSEQAAAFLSAQHAATGSSKETPRSNSAPLRGSNKRSNVKERAKSFEQPPFKHTDTSFRATERRLARYNEGEKQDTARVPTAIVPYDQNKKPAAKPARHGGKKTKKIKMKHKKKMNRKKTKKIKMKHKKN